MSNSKQREEKKYKPIAVLYLYDIEIIQNWCKETVVTNI